MLKPGAYSLLNRISIAFFAMLSVFFMAHSISKEDMGVWALFLSVVSVLELVRNGFIRNPFITHVVSAEPKDRNEFTASSLALHCWLALITIVFLVIGARPLATLWKVPVLEDLFYIYALRSVVLIPSLHFEYLQQAQLEFRGVFINNALRAGLFACYNGAGYFMHLQNDKFHPGLVELGWAYLITAAISVIMVYPIVSKLPFEVFPRNYTKKTMVELTKFGKYTLGTVISSMVMRSTDSWMIGGSKYGAEGVGSYNPALRFANLVEVPTLAISSLVFPQVSGKMKERGAEGVKDIYIKSVSVILAIMLPLILPLYLFAEFFVRFMFGNDYMEAVPILQVTIFYTLIIPFNRQFGTVMDALKTPKINFYLLVMMVFLNAILNYYLLKYWGLMGSAYATLISYLIIFVLNQLILWRMFSVNTFKVIPATFEWYFVGWEIFQTKVLKRLIKG
jgi:O-antigen/teichoic acid export membrane protein